jgi:hypothetical protein
MLRAFLFVLLFAFASPAHATDCEPSAATRYLLTQIQRINGESRAADLQRLALLNNMLAQHPDDVFLHRAYQNYARRDSRTDADALIARYRGLAEKHPANPAYTVLYANALVDTDTPKAISLYKDAISSDSPNPLAHLGLAYVYEWGKFADHVASRTQLDTFFSACPASLDSRALSLLESNVDQQMAARFAAQLRARLVKEKDLDLLPGWGTVWNLEFKAHPPNEHDAVRKQIHADLERLQRGLQPRDVRWLQTLYAYNQLGDTAAEDRIADRMLAEYPESFEARAAFHGRWNKAHPYPKEDDTHEAKQAYYRDRLQLAEDQLLTSPHDFEYIAARFDALKELDSATPQQIVSFGEALRASNKEDPGWFATPPYEFMIAKAYAKRKIRLDEVPLLIDEGWQSYCKRQSHLHSDREPDDFVVNQQQELLYVRTEAARILLDAAQKLNKPDIARDAVEQLADAKPDKALVKADLWEVKAKWAEVNGRKFDALLMYKAALSLRPGDPKAQDEDTKEVAERFDRIWKELGGTAETKDLFAAKTVETVTDDRWEKNAKTLPAWRLTDLQGKAWTAESLKGKNVLVRSL